MKRLASGVILAVALLAAPAGATDDAKLRQGLFDDARSPAIGNPDGDVTVVEFFDYRCPYCRRVAPDLEALIEGDPGVRVVFKEWPILGRASVKAARAALAAHAQGHYHAVHSALMTGAIEADEGAIIAFAVSLGADGDRLRADMTSDAVTEALIANDELARALGLSGTPAFVIGDTVVPGAIPIDQMRALVAEARAGS
jgi:protein-disulfide isomerase